MRRFLSPLLYAALAVALAVPSSVLAVDAGGDVRGVVLSADGKPVADAEITLVHTSKGVVRTTISNEDGEYSLTSLPVGKYTVTVFGAGFATVESEVSVVVGRPVVLESKLAAANFDDVLDVVGTVVRKLDMAETTGGMSYDAETVELLPVDNGLERLVLITPGTVENGAPGAFRGASSIGGASSAENGYYLNGINITQIQSGLGSFNMPWEAIQQTNVQTSGIGAAFGGALGGVVNSVSKSGSNEFHYGFEARLDPESGRSNPPSVRQASNTDFYWLNNEQDEEEFTEYNIWASGPIVKDKAFFYALYNPRTENYQGAGNSTFSRSERKSDGWFLNLEWFVTNRHSIGFTSFNTERDRTTDNFDYDRDTNMILESTGQSFGKDGGKFYGINYHGELTDRLSMDLVIGRTEEEEVPVPANSLVLVQDCSSGSCSTYSNHSNSTIEPQEFSRDQYRLDFHLDLVDHKLSFGIDTYEIDVFVDNRQNGVFTGDPNNVESEAALGWWLYGISGSDSTQVGSVGVTAFEDGIAPGTEFVRRRVRNRFSDSTVESRALYLEDSWELNDVLTLNLGVRYSEFKNTVSSGEAYADLKDNWAPRLAAIWDVGGKGNRKLYASLGRYFQPVAARMNITQGSSSVEYFDYYQVVDPGGAPTLRQDGSPERGAQLGERLFRQTGITDPNLIASKNLKAMYSDQISVGYSQEVFNGLTASVRATYNELGRSVEDTDYAPVLTNVLTRLGFIDPNDPSRDTLREIPPFQGSFYILANPGEDVEIAYDFDGDGVVDEITLTAEDLQLAKPERTYTAVEFTLGGQLTPRFGFDTSYTWSRNRGNTEGLVKTTNGQADPGWTSDYDYGESLDHAYGDLPNDRRHSFKFAGRLELADNWTLGTILRSASGRPLNILTPHPLGVDGCAPGSPWESCSSRSYVGAFYDENGNPVPRGTAGNLPWTHNLDLSLAYHHPLGSGNLQLKATVYNVLDGDEPIDVQEFAGPDYGLVDIYQTPRYMTLTARLGF